jgi:hypothetical protein
VTPSVESIIRKCLEPDPDSRYQTAVDLAEDLRLQLGHRPLRFAPEPSVREQVHKWIRRNPRLASWTTAVLATVALFALVGWGLAGRQRSAAAEDPPSLEKPAH